MRAWAKNDVYFLLRYICRREDVGRRWLFDRCREVQAEPDGVLDLWAREHYKSTIITFGLTVVEMLRNPEITIAIFSYTRPAAKKFLKQIKEEFENNALLKELFPDVLYAEPRRQSPVWSEDGIRVKRKGGPKEQTLEAWGVVDGQPTGAHFDLRVYDDVVTLESVTSPEQIKKTTDAVKVSEALGKEGGRKRFIGTRYAKHDTYENLISEGVLKPRIYPATDNGRLDGKPVLLTGEYLAEKRVSMGAYIFGCQMLQDPTTDAKQSFKSEWLRYYEKGDLSRFNIYMLRDPAGKKKPGSDYTVDIILGLGEDGNYYLIDGRRERLNLNERTERYFELHRKYKPLNCGYEEYGLQSDIEHVKYVQERKNYRFPITPLGGRMAKADRIKRLQPKFQNAKFYLPRKILYLNTEKKIVDFIAQFLEEYDSFPVCQHDDILDCCARILDEGLKAQFPMAKTESEIRDEGQPEYAERKYKVI